MYSLSKRRGVAVAFSFCVGAIAVLAPHASAASCSDYKKISTMTASGFSGAQTRDYGILYTEIVDAYPGAKACIRINASGETPEFTVSGLDCQFAERDADATALHLKIAKELKTCLSGWSKSTQEGVGGSTLMTFKGSDPLVAWKLSLMRRPDKPIEVELKYERQTAVQSQPAPGDRK